MRLLQGRTVAMPARLATELLLCSRHFRLADITFHFKDIMSLLLVKHYLEAAFLELFGYNVIMW